ncbi:MAG: Hdr-like menaquinol oxidoreductase cytochrome c subunit [Alphaproteobacteria bacterium]|nr:Hdr-like menaquinol oxidoreductase cytochrome c subunit [Alphaproteobacteria bacterium]MDP6621217.1 Hdr-like menaquinol oxidoreductase cytochrome c subunit [Alphaproteobacteria bacterium]
MPFRLGVWLLLALLALPAAAGERVPVPQPQRGQGEACVADTEYMRRFHGDELKRQRDQTLRLGIRGGKFALSGCLDCHAVRGADAKPVDYDDPRHFCQSCHGFAAVRIDCFDCHSAKPEQTAGRSK